METEASLGENEAREKYALIFAKALANQTIHDPDGRTSRRKSRTYSAPTQEEVEGYLQAPSANEKTLRNASIYLYQANTRYRTLVNYFPNLLCWYYTINPVNYNKEKVKPDNFKRQYTKVCNILEAMCVEKTMREIVTVGIREGAYYGVIWGNDGSSFILQKLDPDYCYITNITDGGVFQFKYDMSQVKETDVDTYYPPAFRELYDEYRRTGERYQLVPSEISVCFKADPTVVEYSIPVFAGAMPTLFQLENVKSLVETATEMSNYKLLAGKIPLNDNGDPMLDFNTAMQYYDHIADNVGDRVGVALSPFDLKDYTFEQSGTTAQIDSVARASTNFFAEAGTSALLHGATNDTAGVTKLAIKSDEALAYGWMYQCEKIINRILKMLSGTAKFKVHFLEVTQYNREEKIDEYKNAMNYGVCKLEYLATLGIHQYDILGENYIEQQILDIDNLFTPMKTASTRSAEDAAGQAGRPAKDDGDLSASREQGVDNDEVANR